MSSASHKKNILNPIYQKLGVGYDYNDPDFTNHRWYWTQEFGDSLKSPALTTVEAQALSTANTQSNTVSRFIPLSEGNDTHNNSEYGATIDAQGGNDLISNTNLNVSINGGDGDDTLNNSGSFATINAGKGNDQISLSSSTKENVIQYANGDGSDTIRGLHSTDTVSISGSEFTPAQVGNDIVVTVGTDSITLVDAMRNGVQIVGTRSKLFIGTENADTLENDLDNATIQALGGNDTIENVGSNVTIDSGAGKDYVYSYGNAASVNGGAGEDSIDNAGANVTVDAGNDSDYIFNTGTNASINGAAGNDTLFNNSLGSGVTMDGGVGNDYVSNYSENVTIDGGYGNDYVLNQGNKVSISGNVGNDNVDNVSSFVTINTGEGNDSVVNLGSNVTIDGGEYNDTIHNAGNSNVSIAGGDNNDSIENGYFDDDEVWHEGGSNITIDGGDGEDFIINDGANVTINGGTNRDLISLGSNAANNLLVYNSGDGSDIIEGLNATSTLRIGDGTGTYSKETSGDNVIVNVGTDKITLRGAANVSFKIEGTEGEAGSDTTPADRYITLSEGGDTYRNSRDDVTINAIDGNDYCIVNKGMRVSISGANGKDSIGNNATTVIIDGNDGDDFLSNEGNNCGIIGGTGNDSIENIGTEAIIDSGEGDDTVNNWGASAKIGCGDGKDSVYNEGVNTTILGFAGNDTIRNRGENVTIFGGDDDDYINNDSDNALIFAGDGEDIISLSAGARNNLIMYNAGNGEDFVRGFNSDDTLGILSDYVVSVVSGDKNHVYVITGEGHSVILENAASLGSNLNIVNRDSIGDGIKTPIIIGNKISDTLITGSVYGDDLSNKGTGVTIKALGGNDKIYNYRSSVFASISSVLSGSDGDSVSIDSGDGNDTVENNCSNVTIDGGDGNDSIYNYNHGDLVIINGGEGDDTLYNSEGNNVTINGGAGTDAITNNATNVSIAGGADNDTINSNGANVSITGGTGDDRISLNSSASNNFINYTSGDGNDIIWGYSANTTLNIAGAKYVTEYSGDDIVYKVGNGSITLKDARDKPKPIIIGESGSAGGTDGGNNGDNDGGNSSSGTGGGNSSGGNDGGKNSGGNNNGGGNGSGTEGGVSTSEGRSNAASGGKSATGSSGRGTSSGISDSGGSNDGSRHNPTATPSASTSTQQTSSNTFDDVLNSLQQNQQIQQNQPDTTVNQHVYAGGNQVISNYISGEKIIFGEIYTGSFFDNMGNYCVGSSTGALVVQNAMDKVIDLSDYAGNAFVKAYAASTAGVIDGRGQTGFEIINGSAGTDIIYAGDGNSQLWGGNGDAGDILVGGNGSDIFIGGKTQGADIFLNASSADIVHLNDATLSDIVATAEENGTIGIQFNTGNVVAIQSSEPMSAAVVLADGSAYRFNHVTRSWQTA